MESVRSWLEQTIGMPIDYIAIVSARDSVLHVLIKLPYMHRISWVLKKVWQEWQ